MMKMPLRCLGISFTLDTNRINTRQKDAGMNQLERWEADGLILLNMPLTAAEEAIVAGARNRREKILSYVLTQTFILTGEDQNLIKRISNILFDGPPKNKNQMNDVVIVYSACKNPGILITEDGDSKRQPGGILGKRAQLKTLGISADFGDN